MKYRILSVLCAFILLFSSEHVMAQSSGSSLSQGIMWMLIICTLIAISLLIGDNMVRAQAKLGGVDVTRDDSSFFPGLQALMGNKVPRFVKEGTFTKLSKGYDIKLEGEAEADIRDVEVNSFAVQPKDFRGIAPIPKMMVEPGQEVKAGDPLFYDKSNPDIVYVSPVSGEMTEVRRGAKRAITEVVVLADKQQQYRTLSSIDVDQASRDELRTFMMSGGFWPHIVQRPFDVVADPAITPRDIFISTFDSAPLAPDMDLVIEGKEAEFQRGLDALAKMTDGAVHLGLDARTDLPHAAYVNANNVQKHWFSGKHPVGNVGIQIHHISPIKPGDTVWTLKVEDVILLGDMILNHRYHPQCIVALTGNGMEDTHYVRTMAGANLGDLLKGQAVDDSTKRVISGDVLSGKKSSLSGFLHAGDNQVTVIPEGNDYEMFGWLLPALDRPTLSKTYPTFMFPDLKFDVDTNTHGEPRAFVQTGQYESVLPINTYPQHLMKAIMIKDYEKMEGLGLQELSEEDIALCEFACTSKQPLQKILREGLDLMREQG